MKVKKKRETPEAEFVESFIYLSTFYKCRSFIIPDPVINEDNKHLAKREKRRPFDFVFITPYQTFCLEAKYADRKQKEHQKKTERKFNEVRKGVYYVIRKKMENIFKVKYTVESEEEVIFTTQSLDNFVRWFLNKNKEK